MSWDKTMKVRNEEVVKVSGEGKGKALQTREAVRAGLAGQYGRYQGVCVSMVPSYGSRLMLRDEVDLFEG